MLPSFLLSLREGLEAALIVGIVLGALRQIRRTELASSVWWGVAAATVISIVAGVVLTALGLGLEQPYEQIFEGATMFLAAGILTWMIFWMGRQSRYIKGKLEAGVRQAVMQSGSALFALAFFAVVREGIELALFLSASAFASNALQTIFGALFGLFAAVLLGWSLFASTIKLDLRRFFQVTGILLILFAAGLIAHGVHEFNEVGWIPAVVEHVWNTNAILDENSMFGAMLKALFGYSGSPSLTEVVAYLIYFVAIFLGLRTAQKREAALAPRAN
jgi:high-affinity iron transporter